MATAFTHAIVGGSLGQLLPKGLPKVRLVFWLAVASVVPDLDVVTFKLGIPYGHMLGHRGFSHSLAFALLAAPFFALAAVPKDSWLDRAWWGIVGLFAVAVASHGLLDAITDAGLGIGFFVPFSEERYFFPWRPLITPSVSPVAFFNAKAAAILRSEITAVWLPLFGASLVFQIGRLVKNIAQRRRTMVTHIRPTDS
ncbi:MAG: metal-dependent hydrolase [bacterium]|nr:metal-dependent hydrolase [bacterium]